MPPRNRTRFLFKGICGYRKFMKIAYDLTQYQSHPEVAERLKIITFFDHYGLAPTRDAFGVGRSTIFLWKQKLKAGRGSLSGLINKSRKPYNLRRMLVDEKIYLFIKSLREDYPRVGKDKIKILLDDYCRSQNLQSISASKVGKIIRRNHWYLYLGRRSKTGIRADKQRVFGYEVAQPGDLFQIDSVVRFEHGIKRYLLTATDVVSKFSFAFAYKSHSSLPAADFMAKLTQVTPYPIKAIQTDNGSEFLDHFDRVAKKAGVVHFFTYPRCPKQNACIERFNRTLQEEFVDGNCALLEEPDTKIFNNALIDYLLWYNTKRPHNSLGNKVPMSAVTDYLQKSNMCGTDTKPGF